MDHVKDNFEIKKYISNSETLGIWIVYWWQGISEGPTSHHLLTQCRRTEMTRLSMFLLPKLSLRKFLADKS